MEAKRRTTPVAVHDHLIAALEHLEAAGTNLDVVRHYFEKLAVHLCEDCGEEVEVQFFVRDELWRKYGAHRGHLHTGCLAKRMGRRLIPADFQRIPVNELFWLGVDLGRR